MNTEFYRTKIAKLEADVERLREAFTEAAISLDTLSRAGLAVHLDDFLSVRAYAANRATAAREALALGEL